MVDDKGKKYSFAADPSAAFTDTHDEHSISACLVGDPEANYAEALPAANGLELGEMTGFCASSDGQGE